MYNRYRDSRVRELCHGVKERDPVAIREMADYFLNLDIITSNSILIPAPQHEGRAIYTKKIAEILSRETGCRIADILKSAPRKPLYEQKKLKQKMALGFYLEGQTYGDEMYFLDNVIDTGTTYREANRLLNGILRPLVYAVVGTR